MLKSLDQGISEQIIAASIEVDVMVVQVSSGRMLGNFKAGGKRYGHGKFLIMRAALHDAVLQRVKYKDISFNKKVESVTDGVSGVRIEFEDSGSVEVDVVIGADGLWGRTRQTIPESAKFRPEYE